MPETPASSHEHPHICTECALCCNGTLFGRVPAKQAEVERLKKIGFALRPQGREIVFDQPCQMLKGRCCGIYEDRPQTCRKFACLLVKALEAGEVSRSEALQRIATARRLLDDVVPLLREGQSIAQARAEWGQRIAKAGSPMGVPADAQYLLRMLMLNRFLDRHFLRDDEKVFNAIPGEEPEPPPAPKRGRRPPP
jgi:Fe-S-cluster containining protein